MPSYRAQISGSPGKQLLRAVNDSSDLRMGARSGATNLPPEGGKVPPIEEMPVRSFGLWVGHQSSLDTAWDYVKGLEGDLQIDGIEEIDEDLETALFGSASA